MISRIAQATQADEWPRQLTHAFRDGLALLRYLQLDPSDVDWSIAAAQSFRCLVPLPFARRMRPSDPLDPLLLQVLPTGAELLTDARFTEDPLAEADCQLEPGLLGKYAGRLLITATGACAVHCRYCFRRHYPYARFNPAADRWRAALDRIRARTDCTEVILSGGDPLMLPDPQLDGLLHALARIEHIERLRIHTRMPVVLPARVNAALLETIAALRKPLAIVWHVNHANEIDDEVAAAAAALRQTGATLLNQSVLLRGVNDGVDHLAELSKRIYDCGVLPYYLHLLDRVRGTAHFEVDDASARELELSLRDRLPGYLVPKFVRERPGYRAKQPLSPPQNEVAPTR